MKKKKTLLKRIQDSGIDKEKFISKKRFWLIEFLSRLNHKLKWLIHDIDARNEKMKFKF
ncbi:hypothetical protein KKH36_04090 [Patescibacteria group bacterium]|nr:hypothetical protein [Patescibacteria group bacterium]